MRIHNAYMYDTVDFGGKFFVADRFKTPLVFFSPKQNVLYVCTQGYTKNKKQKIESQTEEGIY